MSARPAKTQDPRARAALFLFKDSGRDLVLEADEISAGVVFKEARQGGLGVTREGVTLDSAYAPRKQAKEIVEAQSLDGAEMIVVFGCGGGALVRQIFDATHKDSPYIAVMEPEPAVLRGALERSEDLRACDPARVQCFTSLQSLQMHIVHRFNGKNKLLVVASPAYQRQYPELIGGLSKALEEAVALASVNTNTINHRARHWVDNLLANLSTRIRDPSLFALQGAFKGVPAILVAAGPSLDRNAHLLRGLEDKALILCVNTSLKALLAAGVQPHLVLCLESLDVSAHFQGAEEGLSRASLVLDLTSNPRHYSAPAGRIFSFFNACQEHLSFANKALGDDGLQGLAAGGSIANAAFSCANLMGCSPLVLIGQDLAYTGGQVYASKTVFGDMTIEEDGGQARLKDPSGTKQQILDDSGIEGEAGEFFDKRALFPVTDWDGDGQVMTSMDFNLFRHWFQEAGAQARATDGIETINATEGGAHLDGYEHTPLAEVIAARLTPRPSRDFHVEIEGLWEAAPKADPALWRQGLDEAIEDCRVLCRTARLLEVEQEGAMAALGRSGPEDKGFIKALDRLTALEARLHRLAYESPLIESYVKGVLYALVDLDEPSEDSDLSDRWQTHMDHSQQIITTIHKAACDLLERLEQTRGAG